jgi:predicted nucleic acid-binding protein
LRVFLDTNVLVSSFTTRGICADVVTVVVAEHQLVLGETVLVELTRVLAEKMKVPPSTVR